MVCINTFKGSPISRSGRNATLLQKKQAVVMSPTLQTPEASDLKGLETAISPTLVVAILKPCLVGCL